MERGNSYRVVSPPRFAFFPRINPGVILGAAPNGAFLILVCHGDAPNEAFLILVCHIHFNYSHAESLQK
jgi:hypothetical protein